jgi:hypothetical protein
MFYFQNNYGDSLILVMNINNPQISSKALDKDTHRALVS